MASGDDRISSLSDQLIHRILHFTPAKEAATTSLLSTRWRSLWRSTGAVDLAFRVTGNPSSRHDFVRTARAALDAAAAAAGGVMRFALRLESSSIDKIRDFLVTESHRPTKSGAGKIKIIIQDVLRDVFLSHPAASRVEELVVAAVEDPISPDEHTSYRRNVAAFELGLGLPVTLTGCRRLHAGVPLPRLTTLRLRVCTVQIDDLQEIIDAAPALATVRLESVYIDWTHDDGGARIRFPASTTALVLDDNTLSNCGDDDRDDAIEVDAPGLRSFGVAVRFSLVSPAPDIVRVELDFHDGGHGAAMSRRRFWRFLHSFRNVKVLKVKVYNLKHIAIAGKAMCAKLLVPLTGVELLEIDGVHEATSKTAAVAIGNLLRCCPAVRDLVLRLSTTVQDDSMENGIDGKDLLQLKRERIMDLNESLHRFACRQKLSKPSPMNSVDEQLEQDGDIVGLTGHSFACLQSSLRRVGIQFRLDEHNFLGVQLIKFFAEKAVCLEEMCVDDGNMRMGDHINHRVERWTANLSAKMAITKHQNDTGNPPEIQGIERSVSHFRVLPLDR
uniref:F-box domain-containing protein n=1 Tax=Leersia perrieri TaxID=77586 RepID=A0A0D9XSQ7_9ORYZ